MIRIVPTPARASSDTIADPVAPQPTTATFATASLRCPSEPIPGNRICREYRSSKEVTTSAPSLYYRCGPIRPVNRAETGKAIGPTRQQLPYHTSSKQISDRPRLKGACLRVRGAVWIAVVALALTCVSAGQSAPGRSPIESLPAANGVSSYRGLTVREILFPGLSDADQELMRK